MNEEKPDEKSGLVDRVKAQIGKLLSAAEEERRENVLMDMVKLYGSLGRARRAQIAGNRKARRSALKALRRSKTRGRPKLSAKPIRLRDQLKKRRARAAKQRKRLREKAREAARKVA